jgi:V8-like Glu-specific endopeptidase
MRAAVKRTTGVGLLATGGQPPGWSPAAQRGQGASGRGPGRDTVDAGMINRRGILIGLAFVALMLPATAVALRHRGRVSPQRRRRMPVATTTVGVPQVGALYGSATATRHGCTASVVDSPRGNVLVTAAHCVAGSGAGMVFVPGQSGSRQPDGRWTVTAAYSEPEWRTSQDPRADVAFLTVAPRMIGGVRRQVEQVTGAYRLGSTAVRGERVTVIGYPAGAANSAIRCATKVYLTKGVPAIDCRGFVSGTSGSPWLRATPHGAEIVGVIGGQNQGGCFDYTSYSSPLTRDADTAYSRAREEAPPDIDPPPGGDGC